MYIRSKKDDPLLQRINTPIKITRSNLAPEVSFVALFIIILTYLQIRLPHDRMKSYIEWYHRKSLIQPLSLFQIIRTFLKLDEILDHAKDYCLKDHKYRSSIWKLKKQLPTWLAKIVNILIVLGALLSILACPIWVQPLKVSVWNRIKWS